MTQEERAATLNKILAGLCELTSSLRAISVDLRELRASVSELRESVSELREASGRLKDASALLRSKVNRLERTLSTTVDSCLVNARTPTESPVHQIVIHSMYPSPFLARPMPLHAHHDFMETFSLITAAPIVFPLALLQELFDPD